MHIHIRNERADDAAPIYQLTVRAFRDAPHTDHTEQYLVEGLRQAEALTVSKVAVVEDVVVGHVAMSPVRISNGDAG